MWEQGGARALAFKVIAKKLTYNPTTGELWAVCQENRGTTGPDIVLAVYRAGDNNDSWTEVTALPVMNSPANPAIAVDSQGTVYVAFNQIYTDQATYSHRYAALIQYDGSSWSTVGDPEAIQYGTDPQNITLLVDGDDVLHALWSSGEGRDTIAVDEHQYRLWKLGASGWESAGSPNTLRGSLFLVRPAGRLGGAYQPTSGVQWSE